MAIQETDFQKKLTQIYSTKPKPDTKREKQLPEERLRKQLEPKLVSPNKELIRARLIDAIKFPMNALVQALLDKPTNKKFPQIKINICLTRRGTAILGISNIDACVTHDPNKLVSLLQNGGYACVLCSEWPTALVSACIIAQLMVHAGIWEEYYLSFTEGATITNPKLLLFLEKFPELARLLQLQRAAIYDSFLPILEQLQAKIPNQNSR